MLTLEQLSYILTDTWSVESSYAEYHRVKSNEYVD